MLHTPNALYDIQWLIAIHKTYYTFHPYVSCDPRGVGYNSGATTLCCMMRDDSLYYDVMYVMLLWLTHGIVLDITWIKHKHIDGRQFISYVLEHDNVIKWKHFLRYWPFVWAIHRSPKNYPYKGKWSGALLHYLICAWINGWINNRRAGDLRCHSAHYDVIAMKLWFQFELKKMLWH